MNVISTEPSGIRAKEDDHVSAESIRRPLMLSFAILLFVVISSWLNYRFLNTTGDVFHYRHYSDAALAASPMYPMEYPPLSALIFVFPALFGTEWYTTAFSAMAALAVTATVLVVDRLCQRGALLLLLLFVGCFGTLFVRYDIFVVLLTVLAYATARRRRWLLAQVLLTLGVALKLYPIILMPLIVLEQWRVERRLPAKSANSGILLIVAAIGAMLLFSPDQFVRMLHYHCARPIEIESTQASIAWILGHSRPLLSFGSWNLDSPLTSSIGGIMTGATIVSILALYAGYLRGKLDISETWALSLTVVIACSKVFSTQYLLWAIPFVVIATAGKRGGTSATWLWLMICALTLQIYPIGFNIFNRTLERGITPWGLMGTITLRNFLLLLYCVHAAQRSRKPANVPGQSPPLLCSELRH